MALLETDMADESNETFADRLTEIMEFCIEELSFGLPLRIVIIDMGSRLKAFEVHEDGSTIPISDADSGVSELLYPVHVLIVGCEGQSVTYTAKSKDEPLRTLH